MEIGKEIYSYVYFHLRLLPSSILVGNWSSHFNWDHIITTSFPTPFLGCFTYTGFSISFAEVDGANYFVKFSVIQIILSGIFCIVCSLNTEYRATCWEYSKYSYFIIREHYYETANYCQTPNLTSTQRLGFTLTTNSM